MRTNLNETPAYELAGLIMDLMSKIRKDVISILEFKKFLTMKSSERRKIFGIPVFEEHPKMKLMASGIEIPELTEEIDFYKHFTENKKVRYWLGDNFKKYVLNSAKKVSSLPTMSFDKQKFTETIYDKEIMEHFQISESAGLMTREEICRTIAYLTSKQPKGETGTLQTNGYSIIIGYILCDDSVVRAVYVYWNSDGAEWRCFCYDLDHCYADDEMLSRN